MHKPFRRMWSISALLVLVAPAVAQLQPTAQEQFDGSVRALRLGVNPMNGAPDLAVLGALRELADPSLKPLWYQLAQQERFESQVHAVLALSEMSPDTPADAWMIAQLRSQDAQRAVIATLLDRKGLTPDQTTKLLESDVLDPVTELWLLADLVSRGAAVEQSRLRELASSGDIDLEGLAACLLAQRGDESLLTPHAGKIAALPPEHRDLHLMELFIAIEQYKLTASLMWMRALAEKMPVERQVRWQAVHAMLALSPAQGAEMWNEASQSIVSHSEWVRAVLLLLDTGANVPVDTYRIVPRDSDLMAALSALGEAMAQKQSLVQPLITVIDLGQLLTSRWALAYADKLTPSDAAIVLTHVIDNIERRATGRDDRAEMAVIATEMLYKIDPDAVLAHLARVEDDSVTQEVMLLGLLRCRGNDIGEAASNLRRIGTSRADSMTLLLIAKHADKLPPADLKQLGLIAAGGGQLTSALQAQAAWLYLKFNNRTEQALNRIFAKE